MGERSGTTPLPPVLNADEHPVLMVTVTTYISAATGKVLKRDQRSTLTYGHLYREIVEALEREAVREQQKELEKQYEQLGLFPAPEVGSN